MCSSLETNCLCALELSSGCDRAVSAFLLLSGRVTGAVISYRIALERKADDGALLFIRKRKELERGGKRNTYQLL